MGCIWSAQKTTRSEHTEYCPPSPLPSQEISRLNLATDNCTETSTPPNKPIPSREHKTQPISIPHTPHRLPSNSARRLKRNRANTFPLGACSVTGCPHKSTHACSNCGTAICEKCLLIDVYTQRGGAHIIYCIFCSELFIL